MTSLTPDESRAMAALLGTTRWAVLATASDHEPLGAWVAVAPDAEPGKWLLHLSQLARHTRNLLDNPRAALSFSEPDADRDRDPQTLMRVGLQGRVHVVARDTAAYLAAGETYLAHLPQAAVQFTLGDFYLMRFVSESARVVPGFGRAHSLDAEALRAMLSATR